MHVFILRGGNLKFDALCELTKKHYKEMVRCVVKRATPFLAHVTSNAVTVKTTSERRSSVKRGD